SATDPAPLNASLASKTTQVVVATPIATAATSAPAAAKRFGYWFDAIAGSRVTLTLRFSGADAPTFHTLIDDRGTPVPLGDNVLVQTGSGVRITNFTAPRTSRYFLVFNASPTF